MILVCEIYDIQNNKLKFIKEVELMKDPDNHLLKTRMLFKRASFVTNGKILLILNKR